jgi:predicted enzyme related to lactoylglutathione lyase
MSNQVIGHIEIPCPDFSVSSVFYKKVFEWDFREFGKGYMLYNTHKGMTIGLRKVDTVISGDTTVFHVHVDEVEKYCDLADMAGGKIFKSKSTIPVYGWYALIEDPFGNKIGLFQSPK